MKPKGLLATEWTYVRNPGVTSPSEGVDFFVGEQAVKTYARTHGLLEDDQGVLEDDQDVLEDDQDVIEDDQDEGPVSESPASIRTMASTPSDIDDAQTTIIAGATDASTAAIATNAGDASATTPSYLMMATPYSVWSSTPSVEYGSLTPATPAVPVQPTPPPATTTEVYASPEERRADLAIGGDHGALADGVTADDVTPARAADVVTAGVGVDARADGGVTAGELADGGADAEDVTADRGVTVDGGVTADGGGGTAAPAADDVTADVGVDGGVTADADGVSAGPGGADGAVIAADVVTSVTPAPTTNPSIISGGARADTPTPRPSTAANMTRALMSGAASITRALFRGPTEMSDDSPSINTSTWPILPVPAFTPVVPSPTAPVTSAPSAASTSRSLFQEEDEETKDSEPPPFIHPSSLPPSSRPSSSTPPNFFQTLLSAAESCADDDAGEDEFIARLFPNYRRPVVPSVVEEYDRLQPGEKIDDYENLESGDDDDGGFFENQAAVDEPMRPGLDVVSDEESDEDEVLEDERIADELLSRLGGAENVASGTFTSDKLRDLRWTPRSSSFEADETRSYPNLATEAGAPTEDLSELAESPLQLFFFFLPHFLWIDIAVESNRYRRQTLEARVDQVIEFQRRRWRQNDSLTVESRATIRARLKKQPDIQPQELTTMIGLLIAHVLSPQTRRFADHWVTTRDGALPAGTFHEFMSRNRFSEVVRDLHFCDNLEPRPIYDKLWKIRRVITVMQKRFMSGWTLPPVFSFDEGVLPCFSRMNTTRMYMPDKPHKWGSKMFLACDAVSAYCYR